MWAVISAGEYRLRERYSKLAVESSKWFKMTTEQCALQTVPWIHWQYHNSSRSHSGRRRKTLQKSFKLLEMTVHGWLEAAAISDLSMFGCRIAVVSYVMNSAYPHIDENVFTYNCTCR